IFTALALSRFLSSSDTRFDTLKDRLIAAAIVLMPCFLIILQNETGLALVYFSFFLAMYREGLPNMILVLVFSLIVLVLSTLLIEQLPLFIIITVVFILLGFLYRKTIIRQRITLIFIIGAWLFSVLFSNVLVPYMFTSVMQ